MRPRWTGHRRSNATCGWLGSPILPCVKDTQYDNVTVRQLVANLVLRDEHAPDFSGPEARQPLPQARLGWNALDAINDETHRADGCAGIDGLQEVVEPTQIPIG